MVYTWTDSTGVKHFTNKEYEVPSIFRAKVKKLYPELGDSEAQRQSISAVPEKPLVVQQPKSEDSAPLSQSAIAPKSNNLITDRAPRKGRRQSSVTEE
jgi:hypothetical protein